MNIQQLHYFLHLAETQNMQQTAEDLFISQPALSKSINNLEKELEVQLFDRIGRRVQLNKYGALFQKRAYRSLNELEVGKEEIYALTNALSGRIDLGFVYSLGPIFITNLLAEYSKISPVKIRGNQNNTVNLLSQLQDGKYDVVFFAGNDSFPDMEQFPDVEITPFHTQPVIFVVGMDHPLSSNQSYAIEDLMAYDFITFQKPSTLRPLINTYFASKNLTPKMTYEVLDDLTLLSFASKNLGIGIFPKSSILNNFGIKEISINEPFLFQTIYLAQNPSRYKSPAVERFLEYVNLEKLTLLKDV
ncbi:MULTISPECIES: LysR family transcriptional regulator [Enterococcus]|uniref:HTH lysR-type domain-containing protein n=1 Tax=Candidatus Enterococcus ferrettii TaxID=2815324 RepID=A0ABV0EJG8_9ENTE|nr:LysR family transcriptional regulator [Enterococcus sp. 665A]MBO1338458.1 LysR family transcriptional regulator [Enterococcus sp. 665A]